MKDHLLKLTGLLILAGLFLISNLHYSVAQFEGLLEEAEETVEESMQEEEFEEEEYEEEEYYEEEDEEIALQMEDCPYFSAMSNYYILNQEDREFDEAEFFDGEKHIRVEGKLWKKYYHVKDENKTASDLQIVRNYENALKAKNGKIIYSGICEGENCGELYDNRVMTGMISNGTNDIWVQVWPYNSGSEYELRVIEAQPMVQEVTANVMFNELEKTGFITLYINFDTGKSTIKADSEPQIEQIAEMLRQNPGLIISIEGHTDNVGSYDSNKKLSLDRANSVMSTIASKGIPQSRMSAAGRGAERPIADNRTEDGRAKNRRVEIVKK